MLQKNKLVLTGIALAVMSVMNTAQAALVCGTAEQIKNSTEVTTLQINNCGAEVQSDPIKLAALASLVADTPALSSAAASALAEGGASAEGASDAFTAIIESPDVPDSLKAEVATAAATVIVENADKTTNTSAEGASTAASPEVTALLGTINAVDSTIVATVVEEVKAEAEAATTAAATALVTAEAAVLAAAGGTDAEIADAAAAVVTATADVTAAAAATTTAATAATSVTTVNSSPEVVVATATAVKAAETAAANNDGNIGAVLANASNAAGLNYDSSPAAFYDAIVSITGAAALAGVDSGCALNKVLLFGVFPTTTCK